MRSWLGKLRRERVVVHTTDDRSFRGVLAGVYPGELVLAHAEALLPAGAEQLVGFVAIPRRNVSWIQSVPEEP